MNRSLPHPLCRHAVAGSIVVLALLACRADDPANPPAPSPSPPGDTVPLFVDAAPKTALDFVHDNGMSGRLFLVEITCGGGALFDADGDGDLDAYLLQGHLLPTPGTDTPRPVDQLYRNDLDAGDPESLRFVDVTDTLGVVGDGYGCAVATGDVDRDGRVDLYGVNLGANHLWLNRGPDAEGRPRFVDATEAAGVAAAGPGTTAVFFDMDADGWLDLFVGNYSDFDPVAHEADCRNLAGQPDYCGPTAYPMRQDVLLRNLGPGEDGVPRFVDVTEAAGLADAPARPTLGVIADDLDGDGDLDLYVANDGEPNHLWLNQGPGEDGTTRFVESALLAGAALDGAGSTEASMGVAAGDGDADGDIDLVLTHLVKETHTLYINDGRGGFRDTTGPSGLGPASLPSTGFGVAWLDVDHDGRLDLAAIHGAVTLIAEQAAAGDPLPLREPDLLLLGRGEPGTVRFEDVTTRAGEAFTTPEIGRGLAVGDVDLDGDLDLLRTQIAGPARLLLNQVGQSRPWLGARIVEPAKGLEIDALGTRVALLVDGEPTQWRRVASDGSYASASDPRVHFGLGGVPDGAALGLRVHWLDGTVEDFSIDAGRWSIVRRGEGVER